MKVTRIDLSAWTASFRYPNLISGIQPTLDVPPLSTVLGLLNAASGQYLTHEEELQVGYYFEYAAKCWDTETIYQIESGSKGESTNNAKSNVIQREFLFDVKLSLYLANPEIAKAFHGPIFPLLLGRSCDLATVDQIIELDLPETLASKIKGQVVPFTKNHLPGKLQALPKYFSNTLPRKNLGTEPFSIVRFDVRDMPTRLIAFRDNTQGKDGIDIFFHRVKANEFS